MTKPKTVMTKWKALCKAKTYIRCPSCGGQADLMMYTAAFCCRMGHITTLKEANGKKTKV